MIPSSVITTSSRPPSLLPLALSHPTGVEVILLTREGSTASASHRLTRRTAGIDPNPLPGGGLLPEHDDAFLLSFTSHLTEFNLALRPSTTLFHPDGIESSETITDDQGFRRTVERRIGKEEVRVFEGVVLDSGVDVERWIKEERAGVVRKNEEGEVKGWARIVVLPPTTGGDSESQAGEGIRFQGSFDSPTQGGLYTIHSTTNYLRTREALDPEPPVIRKRSFGTNGREGVIEWGQPEMVVVRESKIMSPREQVNELRKRGLGIPSWEEGERIAARGGEGGGNCGHDELDFNSDPNHPVYSNPGFQSNDFDSTSLETTWAHTLFGLPSRSPPPLPSFNFIPSDRTSTSSLPPDSHVSSTSHTHARDLGKRQSGGGGDIGGGTNISSNFVNSIGSTTGCPKTAMVVFVGIAADCTYVDREFLSLVSSLLFFFLDLCRDRQAMSTYDF